MLAYDSNQSLKCNLMELSKRDKVAMSVIKAMQEIGMTVISTATEVGTNSIHIRALLNQSMIKVGRGIEQYFR